MRGWLVVLVGVCGLLAGQRGALADRMEPAPKALTEVGVEEHLEGDLPLDAAFVDDGGRVVRLGEYFGQGKPVLLSMNYSNCPMLCDLQLSGLVEGLKELGWVPGERFHVVSVSIDPRELPERARQTKNKYLKLLGRPDAEGGWHQLVGTEGAITRVAESVGFRYTWVRERNEYAHTAVVMVCTPEGKISRYLYGLQFPQQTLRLSLVEAGEGKIGTTVDRILLYCFHYDATAGTYTLQAVRLMKLGGGVTVLVILLLVVPHWLRRRAAGRATERLAAGGEGLPALPGAG